MFFHRPLILIEYQCKRNILIRFIILMCAIVYIQRTCTCMQVHCQTWQFGNNLWKHGDLGPQCIYALHLLHLVKYHVDSMQFLTHVGPLSRMVVADHLMQTWLGAILLSLLWCSCTSLSKFRWYCCSCCC